MEHYTALVTAKSLFAEIRFYGLMFTFYSVIVMLSEHFTRKKKSIKVGKKTFLSTYTDANTGQYDFEFQEF